MAVRRRARAPMLAAPVASAISSSSSGQYVNNAPPINEMALRKPRPKAKPKGKGKANGVPDINQYLAGDTTYQDQMSQLMKQSEQYRTANAGQQSMVNQDFGTALDRLNRQRSQDTSSMTGDYASRGLLNSGLFLKSLGDYNTGYQNQVNDLGTSQQRSLSQLLEDLNNMGTENSAAALAAKQDAIRRRAQKYGITT